MSLFATVTMKQYKKTGEYVRGVWQEQTLPVKSFKGTAQPASGDVLKLLPEGKRREGTIKVFAPVSMQWTAADDENGTPGDHLIWDNGEYEVQTAAKWNNGLIPHWELICIRVRPNDEISS